MANPLLTAAAVALLIAAAAVEARESADGEKCAACHGSEDAAPSRPRIPQRLRPGPPSHSLLRSGLPGRPGKGEGCVACHRGDPRTTRVDLAHRGLVGAATARYLLPGDEGTEEGRRILRRAGCRRCHVSGGEGVSLAASLDLSASSRSPGLLLRALRTPAAAMPHFRFGEADLEALSRAILSNGTGRGGGGEAPTVVHFSASARREGASGHPFATACGPCHRALTERFGLLGSGRAGPDLSSLFTPFHPGRGAGGRRWEERDVTAWVGNPRSVRRAAIMPAQTLKEGEAAKAAEALRIGGGKVKVGNAWHPRTR